MNTNGFENELTYQFTDEDPMELEKDFWFSEWYNIVKDIVYTPKSFICKYYDEIYNDIDSLIKTLPGKVCFARLDNLSSKPTEAYKNLKEIQYDLSTSPRTAEYFNSHSTIIIREFVKLEDILAILDVFCDIVINNFVLHLQYDHRNEF